jgi:hypothetical protein
MANRYVTITAQVTDYDNNPVGGIGLTFSYRVSGSTTWTTLGTATTDTGGVATYVATLPVPGTYDFRVDFAGNSDYEPAYAEVSNVRVKAMLRISITVTPGSMA